MREITSSTNPIVKQLRALVSSKKARQESGTFIAEGWRGIDTLLRHSSGQYVLERLIITQAWLDDSRLPDPKMDRMSTSPIEAADSAATAGLLEEYETILLPELLFEKISDVRNSQGILGVVRHHPQPYIAPETGCLLLLDNLRDPGNLGTLIRSAVGAGFDGILLYGDCVESYNPKVVRSTMGTFACCTQWNVGESEIDQLLSSGFELCVTTGSGGQSLYETNFGTRTILAIGSEAHGISETLMHRATKRITIPLRPECESLNAAVAGSICMFQITCGR